MPATASPVVHDLQFGTYVSSHDRRGRHSRWPCAAGVTRSHGRYAGVWLRVGDRSYWCCLERPRRWTRAERAQRVRTGTGAPVYRVMPGNLPPARTAEMTGPTVPRHPAGRRLRHLASIVTVILLVAAVVWMCSR